MLAVFLSILITVTQPHEQPQDLLQCLICSRSVTSYSLCCWLSVGHFWTETTSLTLSLLSPVCGSRSSVVPLFLPLTIEKLVLLCKLLLFGTLIFSVLGVPLFGDKWCFKTEWWQNHSQKKLTTSSGLWLLFSRFWLWKICCYRTEAMVPLHGLLSSLLGSVCLDNILVGIVNRHSTSYDPAPVQPSRQLHRHWHGKLPP